MMRPRKLGTDSSSATSQPKDLHIHSLSPVEAVMGLAQIIPGKLRARDQECGVWSQADKDMY